MPAATNAGTIPAVVGSYHTAMFMPRSWSVTAGPKVDWSTVIEVCTVIVAVWVIAAPVGEVTVRVKIVVTVGLTLAGVPLVTARLPGVITPVPLAKTAVRLELAPAVMVAGFATKLVIVGAGTTVTVTVWVTAVPLEFVTVMV